MYAQKEKLKENKNRPVGNSVALKKSYGKQDFGFLNKRQEVVVRRSLLAQINSSFSSQHMQKKENSAEGIPLEVRNQSRVAHTPVQLMKLYHGTTKEWAEEIAKGTKIKAKGKGELGGGFYLCHNMDQAAHIADYYCASERHAGEWGVVEFDIDDKFLAKLDRKSIDGEEFEEYYQNVKSTGNNKESKHSWSYSKIKDNKTPYIQHLFARDGIRLLNNAAATKRKVVLTGTVGTDKKLYESVEGYDVESDNFEKQIQDLVKYSDDSDSDKSLTKREIMDKAISLINDKVKCAATPNVDIATNLVKNATRLGPAVLEELAQIFDYADVRDTHRQKINGLRPWQEWLNNPRPVEKHLE